MKRKLLFAAAIVPTVLAADLLTKSWALSALSGGRQIETLGGLMPMTLAFNRGAAFGLSIGDDPRLIFVPLTLFAAGFLVHLFIQARSTDNLRLLSTSLVLAGALGNLYDRMRWDQGVVDFLGPINLGFMYWPIFNIADMAITTGAFLLAISFWQEEKEGEEEAHGSG